MGFDWFEWVSRDRMFILATFLSIGWVVPHLIGWWEYDLASLMPLTWVMLLAWQLDRVGVK